MNENAIRAGDVSALNSSGRILPVQRAQRSAIIPVLVPAGQTIPVAAAGTQFYILASNSAINIRVSGGSFNSYSPGTGEDYPNDQAFAGLELQNPANIVVSVLLFVGFSSFIDKRLYLTTNSFSQVLKPTYPVPSAATHVDIPDISGQQFTDINGGKWWAVNRVSLIVSNLDTGATFILQKTGGTGGTTPGVIGCFPQTNLNLPVSGNYSLDAGGGTINCIVSEIYNAFPVT